MTQELIEIKGNFYPVFYCIETKDNWEFLCPYCNRMHKHGKQEGHRCAHCSMNSPLFRTGYYIKLKVKQ